MDGQLDIFEYFNEVRNNPDYIEQCECGGQPIVESVGGGIQQPFNYYLYHVSCPECGMISCQRGADHWISNSKNPYDAIKDWNEGRRHLFGEPHKTSDEMIKFHRRFNPYYADREV